MKNQLVLLAFIISLSFCQMFSLYGQPGSIDLTFNSTDIGFGNGDGFNGFVRTSAEQIDGKIFLGGEFTSYNGTSRSGIARLKNDGALDTSFNIGTGVGGSFPYVYTSIIQPDGKIIIGGDFSIYNGTLINRIARLNTNGSLDTTFKPGSGLNGIVYACALQTDGKLIIGGVFTSFNGIARKYITRLNTDGSLDASFNPGTGASNTILTIAIQTNGKIVIGGEFTSYNGTQLNHIARLNTDGSVDASFNPGNGATDLPGNYPMIWTARLQTDGRIIIGGNYSFINNISRNNIARLNTDGSLDISFNPGTGAGGRVYTSAIQPNGKIIIGGEFLYVNNVSRGRIARLNSDGSVDTTFNPGAGAGSTSIYTTTLESNSKIIIGGNFVTFNGTIKNRLARLNDNGTLDLSFNIGTAADYLVQVTHIQPDGKIIIGGDFTSYNGILRNRIARLFSDGNIDTTFIPGGGANGILYSITYQDSDDKIIIGGVFTSFNDSVRNRIARITADGTLDTAFYTGTGANNTVYTAVLQPDGKIIIGGDFTSYNGLARNHIARLNSNGILDTTFNPGTGANSTIRTISLQPNGKIIIGGWFTTFDGATKNHIARLNYDGKLDATFNPGTGTTSVVYTTFLQPDGNIVIGGDFFSYNGTARNNIARLKANGAIDTTFKPGGGANYVVNSMILQGNGKIVIGGGFTSYNGTPRNYIARLNADGTNDFTFDPGTGSNLEIRTVAFQTDGKLIIGGWFLSYDGIGRNRVARIIGDAATNIGSNARPDNSSVLIYPNPADDIITIDLPVNNKMTEVTIFDEKGKMVYSKCITNDLNITVDAQSFSDGVYFIKAQSDNLFVIKKIVVMR